MIKYSIDIDDNCLEKVKKEDNKEKYHFDYPCTISTSCKPYSIFLDRGIYKLEVWGAQGGDGRIQNSNILRTGSGGRGAYASGYIKIHYNTHLYLYIGGKGEDQIEQRAGGKGGYNGGGDGGADSNKNNEDYYESNGGGGGATDFRLIYNEKFSDIGSLKSRIIVAAGGGSACSSNKTVCQYTTNVDGDLLCQKSNEIIYDDYRGGPGGTLHGYRLNQAVFTGNQTKGSFGLGTAGLSIANYTLNQEKISGGSVGGGGGGYFGGTSITERPNNAYVQAGGAGGSSYVSGCDGCRSVELFPVNEINTTDNNVHYSGLKFWKIEMKSGFETIPSPNGSSEIGHSGDGYAIITFIKPLSDCSCANKINMFSHIYILIILQSGIDSF